MMRMAGWVTLWAGQVVLALFYSYAGYLKLSSSPEALAAMGWHWTMDVPHLLITFVGVAEILGAIGILLPAALRVQPWLTPLACAGLVLLQVAAIGLHLMRGETDTLWLNGALLLIATAVTAASYFRDWRPALPAR